MSDNTLEPIKGFKWTHLQPERCSLANSSQLCGLKVRETQSGEITILSCKSGETIDHHGELFVDDGQGSSKEDKVCVAEVRFWESGSGEKRMVLFARTP